jgi:hypothetical protein
MSGPTPMPGLLLGLLLLMLAVWIISPRLPKQSGGGYKAPSTPWPPIPPPSIRYAPTCRCAIEPYGVSDWSTVSRLCPKHGYGATLRMPRPSAGVER